jgi:hypothetical protein
MATATASPSKNSPTSGVRRILMRVTPLSRATRPVPRPGRTPAVTAYRGRERPPAALERRMAGPTRGPAIFAIPGDSPRRQPAPAVGPSLASRTRKLRPPRALPCRRSGDTRAPSGMPLVRRGKPLMDSAAPPARTIYIVSSRLSRCFAQKSLVRSAVAFALSDPATVIRVTRLLDYVMFTLYCGSRTRWGREGPQREGRAKGLAAA